MRTGAADWPLQQSIYAALKAPLGAAGCEVYDHLPAAHGTAHVRPYAVIGDAFDADESDKACLGQRLRVRVTLFSDAPGSKEIKQLKGLVLAALDRYRPDLATAGMHCYGARYAGGPVMREPSAATGEVIRRADLEFEYLVSQL